MARAAQLVAPGARRIATAAARLFAKHGYAGTSMADVASAAKVSKATVFHHFRSKRRLYEALIGDAAAGFREQLVPLLDGGGPVEEALGRFASAHYRRLARRRPTAQLVLREMAEGSPVDLGALLGPLLTQSFALVVEALRRGQREGTVRADVDPGLAAFVLLSTTWSRFQSSPLVRDNPELGALADAATYGRELARLLCRGLEPRSALTPGAEQ